MLLRAGPGILEQVAVPSSRALIYPSMTMVGNGHAFPAPVRSTHRGKSYGETCPVMPGGVLGRGLVPMSKAAPSGAASVSHWEGGAQCA